VPVWPEGPTEPRPETEADVEGSVEAPKARTAVGATVTLGAATGACPMTHGTQGAPGSQNNATPQAR
jgi:hypothetical protein